MDIIGVCIFGVLALLTASFIGYFITTKKIIDSQEQEIEILKRDNERLKRRLSYDNEIKGAFEPMEFIAQTKPVNPVDYEIMKKLLGDSNGKIIAMVKTDNNSAVVDFPNGSKIGNNTRC